MNSEKAVAALSALAQEHRLALYRLLVQAGDEGMAAGSLAVALGIPSSSLSFHLAHLTRAGIVDQRRAGRSLIYSANYSSVNDLLAFLMENCCGGAGCAPEPVDIIIYHNPACGTSRNVLAMILHAGIEPHVIEYLKTPPSRAMLIDLLKRSGLTPRDLLRPKGAPYTELGLANEELSDDQLIDAMMEHPVLINRPLVVSPLGVRLCRPSEAVLDLLPAPQFGAFTKEDGEAVIDAAGHRI